MTVGIVLIALTLLGIAHGATFRGFGQAPHDAAVVALRHVRAR